MNAKKSAGPLILACVFIMTGCSNNETNTTEFTFPSTGITVKDKAVLLAIDDYLLPFKRDMCYFISKPNVLKDPIITPDRSNPNITPDNSGPNNMYQLTTRFYGTVLFDQGKFRMWHSADFLDAPWKKGQEHFPYKTGPIFYAESKDGINWTKPNLSQVEINGSKNNNAIALPDPQLLTPTLIKDEDEPDPDKQYKMVYSTWSSTIRGSKEFPTMRTAVSPNGINWTAGPEKPVDSFLEHCSFYKFNGSYFVNSQVFERYEGGTFEGRQGYVRISPDFEHWVQGPAESFKLPQPDPQTRDLADPHAQVHLGTSASSLGNTLVGLYGIWHNRPGPEGSHGWHADHGGTWCDLGLVVSHDGIHFREPVKGHVFISAKESEATPIPGENHPTLLYQSNGILNVGEKTFIFHGRFRNQRPWYAEIALATLPRDRWGAIGLHPPLAWHQETSEGAREGWVWSAPIILPDKGCNIFLNADDADLMTVEISDERFNLLPEFSGTKSGTVKIKGGLDCPVIWPKGNLAVLGGKKIRLKINLKKKDNSQPRLYAVYLNKM
jgi:hypothetical protein